MLLIEDMSTLFMMLKDCCQSRVRVPLLCCLHFTIAITIGIVGSHFGCSCCCGVPVALGGNDVMVAVMLIANVLPLLILIEDC